MRLNPQCRSTAANNSGGSGAAATGAIHHECEAEKWLPYPRSTEKSTVWSCGLERSIVRLAELVSGQGQMPSANASDESTDSSG